MGAYPRSPRESANKSLIGPDDTGMGQLCSKIEISLDNEAKQRLKPDIGGKSQVFGAMGISNADKEFVMKV